MILFVLDCYLPDCIYQAMVANSCRKDTATHWRHKGGGMRQADTLAPGAGVSRGAKIKVK